MIRCPHCLHDRDELDFYSYSPMCKLCHRAEALLRKREIDASRGKIFARDPRRLKPERQTYMTPEEWIRFNEKIERTEDKVMWSLMVQAGLRVQECLELTPEWVDFETRAIKVRTLKQRRHWERDIVDLPEELAPYLRAIESDPTKRYFPITYRAAYLRFKKTASLAGLHPRYSPHSLRHLCGYVTAKVTNGNLIEIAKTLRHRSTKTAEHYIHLIPEIRAKIADERWKVLKGGK